VAEIDRSAAADLVEEQRDAQAEHHLDRYGHDDEQQREPDGGPKLGVTEYLAVVVEPDPARIVDVA